MQKKLFIAASGAVVLVALLFAHSVQAPSINAHQQRVSFGGTSIVADIADTEPLREQGLSGRQSLTDSQGMLFIFPGDGMHSFWMKDMLFPIDMLWLSSEKRVVYIAENATPDSYPASFTPTSLARYVLEVPAGWAKRHGVTVGSPAIF